MAVSRVQATSSNATGNTSISVTLSAPATAGNLLIAIVALNANLTPTISGFTAGTLAATGTAPARAMLLLYKIAAGGETTITTNVLNASKVLIVAEYSGGSALNIQNAATTAASATKATPTVVPNLDSGGLTLMAAMSADGSSWSNFLYNGSATGVADVIGNLSGTSVSARLFEQTNYVGSNNAGAATSSGTVAGGGAIFLFSLTTKAVPTQLSAEAWVATDTSTKTRATQLSAEAWVATDTGTQARATQLSAELWISSTPIGTHDVVTQMSAEAWVATTTVSTTSNITESASAVDTVTAHLARAGALTESATAADTVSSDLVGVAALAEIATAADTIASAFTGFGTIADVASAADTVSSAGNLTTSISEAGTAADTISAALVTTSEIAETATAIDIIAISDASELQESASATDTIDAAGVFLCEIAEAATPTDTIDAAGVFVGDLTESANASDTLSGLLDIHALISDGLALADAYRIGTHYLLFLIDSLTVRDRVIGETIPVKKTGTGLHFDIPDPRYLELSHWSALVASIIIPVGFVRHATDDDGWKDWARAIRSLPALAPLQIPDPLYFETWQQWGFRLREALLAAN